ncbi:MAG: hypothetical protein J0M08_08215 [Bacteroidetes bacterium]|nr:hypothetical protein [Bacteroidota bacterium]
MTLGLLVSGSLGLIVLKSLLVNKKSISFVLTDKNSLGIIEICRDNNIFCFAGNPRNGRALTVIKDKKCDILLSINYLFLIEDDLINLPSKKVAINFHGSLLPKYRGRTPHVWAIINNETETGVTAHLIDSKCDTGDIISQRKISIDRNDTGADILVKFNSIYPSFVLEILGQVEKDIVINSCKQDEQKATYYGKRTEFDGEISWDWQKERIFNWVRAQAKPYPGAFTFNNGQKVIIHKVEFSDIGFDYNVVNGTVVLIDLDGFAHVKTPNGCLKLVDIEFLGKFELNQILGKDGEGVTA